MNWTLCVHKLPDFVLIKSTCKKKNSSDYKRIIFSKLPRFSSGNILSNSASILLKLFEKQQNYGKKSLTLIWGLGYENYRHMFEEQNYWLWSSQLTDNESRSKMKIFWQRWIANRLSHFYRTESSKLPTDFPLLTFLLWDNHLCSMVVHRTPLNALLGQHENH